MKLLIKLVFLLLLIFTFISCKNETRDDSISLPPHEMQLIEHKINEFTMEKRQECVTKALNQATERMHSTLLSMDILIPIDVQGNILRPPRPVKPHQRTSTDTTAVQPFFDPPPKDSLRN